MASLFDAYSGGHVPRKSWDQRMDEEVTSSRPSAPSALPRKWSRTQSRYERSLETRLRRQEAAAMDAAARVKERADLVSRFANRVEISIGEEQTRTLIKDLSRRLSTPSQSGKPSAVLGRMLAALTLEQLREIEPVISNHVSRPVKQKSRRSGPANQRVRPKKGAAGAKRRRRNGNLGGQSQSTVTSSPPRPPKPRVALESSCAFQGCGARLSDEERRFSKLHSQVLSHRGYCAAHAAPIVALFGNPESGSS